MAALSPYTLEAMRIISQLDEAGKSNSHFVVPVESKRPDLVRDHVRLMSKDHDWYPRLTTSISEGMLFIRLKEASRIQVLERLLEKILVGIEDEALYEEAMRVLYGGKSE